MSASPAPQFDAIVIGSGITGGWAAKELTEAGLKVLMIERGRMIEHGAGYTRETLAPWELPFHGEGDAALYAKEFAVQSKNRHFNEWTQDHFVNDVENPYTTPGDFTWWRSYQLGGRSLTWGRQCYRWSDHDFGANKADGHGVDWPIRYADLAPWYDKVEEFIGVSGANEGLEQLPDGKFQPAMALNVVEAHARKVIGETWPERRLTIGRTANLTEEKEGRAKCQYRSICARGCSYGAYFSTQSSTLPAAQATGRLTLITDAIVEAIDHDPATGRATGVRVLRAQERTRQTFGARLIFVNAGSFNSNQLLLRSTSAAFPNGLANGSGQLGLRIMDHANTLSVAALVPGFDDRTTFGNRPTGIVIPRFRNLGKDEGLGFTRGYSYQGGAIQSGWTAAKREAGIGEAFKAKHRKAGAWRMVLVTYAESLPRDANRLTLSKTVTDAWGAPVLDIAFAHGDNEHRALTDAKAQGAAMMAALGGTVLFGFDQPGSGGSSIHEMGGMGMSHDPRAAVLDAHSRAHGVKNLFVTDGAQMNSSACQNPSLTYMALTARAVHAAVGMLKEGAL